MKTKTKTGLDEELMNVERELMKRLSVLFPDERRHLLALLKGGGILRCKAVCSVWLVMADMDYEEAYVVAAYASKERAKKRLARIERAHRRFDDAVDKMQRGDAHPLFPDHQGCHISISRIPVIYQRRPKTGTQERKA